MENLFDVIDKINSRLFLIFAALAPLIAGCSNFGYYAQSIDGQAKVLQARQPIAEILADPGAPALLKSKLTTALAIRDFASRELQLPQNMSYRSYADIQRPAVVWNVVAAREFSVEPERWCFPIAGCVAYRGYFARDDAEAFARDLRSEGLDVLVSGVVAYSTLGWLDDPVLNTFINAPEYDLARLIFHELAHQKVYAKDDSEFNESFAVTVEIEGVRRWIEHKSDAKMLAEFERASASRREFPELVLTYREKLASLYRSHLAPVEMRARKAEVFSELQQAYQSLKAKWNGFAGYDRVFAAPNNATLTSIATYNALVPQFQELLAEQHGDLAAFYVEVKELAGLSKAERATRFAALGEKSRRAQVAIESATADSLSSNTR